MQYPPAAGTLSARPAIGPGRPGAAAHFSRAANYSAAAPKSTTTVKPDQGKVKKTIEKKKASTAHSPGGTACNLPTQSSRGGLQYAQVHLKTYTSAFFLSFPGVKSTFLAYTLQLEIRNLQHLQASKHLPERIITTNTQHYITPCDRLNASRHITAAAAAGYTVRGRASEEEITDAETIFQWHHKQHRHQADYDLQHHGGCLYGSDRSTRHDELVYEHDYDGRWLHVELYETWAPRSSCRNAEHDHTVDDLELLDDQRCHDQRIDDQRGGDDHLTYILIIDQHHAIRIKVDELGADNSFDFDRTVVWHWKLPATKITTSTTQKPTTTPVLDDDDFDSTVTITVTRSPKPTTTPVPTATTTTTPLAPGTPGSPGRGATSTTSSSSTTTSSLFSSSSSSTGRRGNTETPTGSPVSLVPTAIYSSLIPTVTVSPDVYAANKADARVLNELYSTLNLRSACSDNQVACIDGNVMTCGSGGAFDVTLDCPADAKGGLERSCFAIPMNSTRGVQVGCFNVEFARSVLGADLPPLPTRPLTPTASTRPVVVTTSTSTPVSTSTTLVPTSTSFSTSTRTLTSTPILTSSSSTGRAAAPTASPSIPGRIGGTREHHHAKAGNPQAIAVWQPTSP
ncbi:hypothetical protein MAPG_03735 [Magnaporthiopsis poae ATCC 64411]|uniref:Uncharacterized protein n=1 Tax=Magnaporthiopsis poae (strain ATCC 64411 / 73-15) TaxID=644358 RepID=A0A0C4DUU2_MAGP6|nr:hypothetical protein MAPG_03735 [Magnaporthiopsis poae ATCC 64411]